MSDAVHEPEPEQAPPVLGRWSRVYAVVLLELALTVALLYAIARWAS